VGSNEEKYHQALLQCQGIINTALGSVEPPVPPPPGPFMVFPATHPVNTRCDTNQVDPNSTAMIAMLGAAPCHPDFGAVYQGIPNGIPWNFITGTEPKYFPAFLYANESDAGPYPIPNNAIVEQDSDAHLILVDRVNGKLYELFNARKEGAGWKADAGAIFDLNTGADRPAGYTSADAAGMAIFPTLAKYDEIMSGEIKHALRYTVVNSRRGYVAPARHFASTKTDTNLLPMGARIRLKASFDISGFPPPVQTILTCLKRYGAFLQDNGSNLFISGGPDDRFDDAVLGRLKEVKAGSFEVCLMGPVTTVGA
jgi:hypothetical protein